MAISNLNPDFGELNQTPIKLNNALINNVEEVGYLATIVAILVMLVLCAKNVIFTTSKEMVNLHLTMIDAICVNLTIRLSSKEYLY